MLAISTYYEIANVWDTASAIIPKIFLSTDFNFSNNGLDMF